MFTESVLRVQQLSFVDLQSLAKYFVTELEKCPYSIVRAVVYPDRLKSFFRYITAACKIVCLRS